ncbi:hypothetical protein Tco_1110472 [Tanacetum coccineum]|uniref:Uncharacterized protein n=1 Tax=Tanacetum coccineum TaxID=301880 RepID=A0ABQ5ILE8_9ASTR
MLLAMKDEAGGTLNDEENDFMLDIAYGDETLEELSGQSVSDIIYDDPYVENNGRTVKHAFNAHDQTFNIESLVYNVQREAKNQQRLNIKLNKQKELLQKELETSRENNYLEDIVDLEEKLSSYDLIVYKMGQSIQTIHMLGKRPNKVYDPFLKVRLGYQNPEHLKKAIAAQLKMYDGERLQSTKLNIDSPDSEETLEDAELSKELKQELTEEVQEMLNIFESMGKKVETQSQKDKMFQNEIDRLLEASVTREIKDCVLLYVAEQKNECLKISK